MQDTFVTFHGWVGGEVRHRLVRDIPVADFRVGVTPRLRRDGEWVDGETAWYTVTVWRQLADHVRRSIRKGDPVIVSGRLRTETWTPAEGSPTTSLLVDATLVGHDLNRGSAHFWRERPGETATPGAEADAAEPDAATGSTGATGATGATGHADEPDEPAA